MKALPARDKQPLASTSAKMRTTSRLSAIPGAALVASRRRCGPEGLRAAVRACATAAPAAPAYHTIVKAEIPVHLPRRVAAQPLKAHCPDAAQPAGKTC